jgi:multisubunit Na+/H+ antiporter MnhG subunit
MRETVVSVLQVATIVLAVLSVAGVALMRDGLDRLHYAAPMALAGACAGAAVCVQGGPSLIGTRGMLLAAILLGTSPVLAHATARAIQGRREREGGT